MPQGSRRADLIVFVGPSGSGKTTLIRRLLSDYPERLGFSISHTTRAPRTGEKDGVDYHYVTDEQFRAMISAGEMIEYSRLSSTTGPGGPDAVDADGGSPATGEEESGAWNYYGTCAEALKAVLAGGKVVLMDTDVLGALNLQQYCRSHRLSAPALSQQSAPQVLVSKIGAGADDAAGGATVSEAPCWRPLRYLMLFITPPSMAVLEQRLRARRSETDASLALRLKVSGNWMRWAQANAWFFDHIIVNNNLEQCYEEVKSAVLPTTVVAHTSSSL